MISIAARGVHRLKYQQSHNHLVDTFYFNGNGSPPASLMFLPNMDYHQVDREKIVAKADFFRRPCARDAGIW